jgi:hypothetical protein
MNWALQDLNRIGHGIQVVHNFGDGGNRGAGTDQPTKSREREGR